MNTSSSSPERDPAAETLLPRLASLELSLNNNKALQLLPPLRPGYFSPWTTSALHPASLRVILHDLVLHKRRRIIEFGAGVSTFYLAKILRQEGGGQLTAVDDSAPWLEQVRQELVKLDLWDDSIQLIHAPLEPCSLGIGGLSWYATDRIRESLLPGLFDLVLVDGPFADSGERRYARFPAVPFLRNENRLAPDFTVFLDDCHRRGEQDIATTWTEEFKLTGQFLPEKGNICYFYPQGASRFNID